MDMVFIRSLRIDTYIGIYDWEQQARQTVVIDLDLAADITASAAKNHISATPDYEAISLRLIEFIENERFQLLETLAEQCASLVMNDFAVPWLRLRLSKPGAVAAADEVGVEIERGQRS